MYDERIVNVDEEGESPVGRKLGDVDPLQLLGELLVLGKLWAVRHCVIVNASSGIV